MPLEAVSSTGCADGLGAGRWLTMLWMDSSNVAFHLSTWARVTLGAVGPDSMEPEPAIADHVTPTRLATSTTSTTPETVLTSADPAAHDSKSSRRSVQLEAAAHMMVTLSVPSGSTVCLHVDLSHHGRSVSAQRRHPLAPAPSNP